MFERKVLPTLPNPRAGTKRPSLPRCRIGTDNGSISTGDEGNAFFLTTVCVTVAPFGDDLTAANRMTRSEAECYLTIRSLTIILRASSEHFRPPLTIVSLRSTLSPGYPTGPPPAPPTPGYHFISN